LEGKSLQSIQKALLTGAISMSDLVSRYLSSIDRHRSYNAFVESYDSEIQAKAERLQKKIRDTPSSLGALFGAVVSLKDNICYEGHKVSAASKMLEGYTSPFSATVVERLLEQDALIIGRTNCDEFSMGSASDTSFYGPVKNAVNPDYVAGGSSGGAAVAVALDQCLISVGSDTGGSIRQPAAFNGVIGFKPSYGMLSRWGLIAYASSLDQIGFIGRSCDDIAQILSVTAGPDSYDSTLTVQANTGVVDRTDWNGSRIGVFANLCSAERLSNEAYKALKDFLDGPGSTYGRPAPIEFENEDWVVPCYYVISAAEAASNLARYDGIRYGYSAEGAFEDYRTQVRRSRAEAFGKEVKKRIILGNYVLSEGYYDAYFSKALKVRQHIRAYMSRLLDEFDFILLPSTVGTPWLSAGQQDPLSVYRADIFTIIANLAGLPSISIPVDNKYGELPLGIQILAKSNSDQSLIAFAKALLKA